MSSLYDFGCDVLSGCVCEVVGDEPLTPAQLSRLDRALTPEEYKVVEEWQAKKAEAELVAERAKGGPTSTAIEVTERGATIRADKPSKMPTQKSVAHTDNLKRAGILEWPPTFWQVLFLLGVVGGGIYLLYDASSNRVDYK